MTILIQEIHQYTRRNQNRVSVSYFSSVSAFNGKSKSPNLLSVKNVLSCSPICSRVGAEWRAGRENGTVGSWDLKKKIKFDGKW